MRPSRSAAKHKAHSLTNLVRQAERATHDLLQEYARRLQDIRGNADALADPVGMRWSKELVASQVRVALRDIHRRIARVVHMFEVRDIISGGEAGAIQETLERRLRGSLKTVDALCAHPETSRGRRARQPSGLPQGSRDHATQAHEGRAGEISSR